MLTTLRFTCLMSVMLLLACCTNPGCLRHSQCGKGFECRDGACQRPLLHDAGPQVAQAPFSDAGWAPLTGAAGGGDVSVQRDVDAGTI